ncbi:MAG: ribonuclease III domain-containing protein [Bacteroides uniformis]
MLLLALTHSSYANENKKGSHENNERLEFLGDAVLDMVVSEYMYRKFPEMPEGELTQTREQRSWQKQRFYPCGCL